MGLPKRRLRCAFKHQLAIAALAAALPGFAMAADLPSAPANPPAAYSPPVPDWIVTIGVEGRIVPAWSGASESESALTGFPLFSVRQQGSPPDFPGARDSIGFSLIDLGQIKIGPAFKLVWQRKASDYAALSGLERFMD
jgi:hypothetical protein